MRRDAVKMLPVTLPDGRTVVTSDVFTVALEGGRVVEYPVTDDPPVVIADGVVTRQLPGGERFEITYRDGVPHGPFKAYFADGARWGETQYERGRQVGPSWIYSRAGSKVDELRVPVPAPAAP